MPPLVRVRERVAGSRTNEILLLIWQEMKALNGRIDQTNSRLETGFLELREEFDAKLDLLGRRVVEAKVRTATAVADLAADVRALAHALREGRPRLEAHESRTQRQQLDILVGCQTVPAQPT